ncbi:MAG: methylmalonyl-CoA mutase family protein [Acidobacteriota bacterium]
MKPRRHSRAPAAPRLEEADAFRTLSGLLLKEVYTQNDLEGVELQHDLSQPGEYPFTRGIHRTMYRGKPWTIRQFSGFGSAADTNRRFRFLLEQGQHGLSTAFDLSTLMGLDSDEPLCRGEVGREGVAIDTLEDMETLFHDIPLERVSTSMTINAPAAVIFAMYLATARRQGASWKKLRGTLQNDILKEYIAQKEWIYPPRPSLRLVTDLVAFCCRQVPQWNPISISGYHIREAGSNAVQELAFTLADGIGYVEASLAAGLDVDDFASRFSFFFNAHNDFFEEVAKLRAARRMWARIMRERFGARDPRSWMLRMHVQTAGCSLTAQQPYVNVVRVTLQALAAVLGGTQSLHTNSLDETYALPTEEAATLAVRTQQVIVHESGVGQVVDPLGGAYFVEDLTRRMEEEASRLITAIEEMGGIVAAIEQGFPQKEIAESSYSYQRQVDSGDKIIVGLNQYQQGGKVSVPTLSIDPEVEREQLARLDAFKRRRSASSVSRALEQVRSAAAGSENLMPHLIAAVEAQATLGELSGTLKEVFGAYQESPVL